jgi:hypothetical protein
LLKGLATQKIISGADESSINRVIVNLTQLSAGSIRASQDIKEIILAMPSLRSAFQDAFGTLDPKTIAALFKDNPDKAIEKLSAAMSKTRQPAAGLNESIDKLNDSVIEAGRLFGMPLLDPLTTDVKDLTEFVRDNEDTWSSWGQSVADTVREVSDVIRGLGALTDDANGTGIGIGSKQVDKFLIRAARFAATGGNIGRR